MKLILDTSVWVEHLRHGALTALLPRARGKYRFWMDGIVAGELVAGCRSRAERRVVEGLIAPFTRAGRIVAPVEADLIEAGRGLSKLREKGVSLKNGSGALLDALIAIDAVRIGALLVTVNDADFRRLADVTPLRYESFHAWRARLDADNDS